MRKTNKPIDQCPTLDEFFGRDDGPYKGNGCCHTIAVLAMNRYKQEGWPHHTEDDPSSFSDCLRSEADSMREELLEAARQYDFLASRGWEANHLPDDHGTEWHHSYVIIMETDKPHDEAVADLEAAGVESHHEKGCCCRYIYEGDEATRWPRKRMCSMVETIRIGCARDGIGCEI